MTNLSLTQVTSFPEKLLSTSAMDLYKIYPTPTLLHLEGQRKEPLFLSILLHGNETTGLKVIQKLLSKYMPIGLPRSISIFFGNTQAARYAKRVIENQPDYNRIWPGTREPQCAEMKVMQSIVDVMSNKNTFASIDIHNNSGKNPYYACINRLDNQFLQLASHFGHTIVYFLIPKGVQSHAFSALCPSVTLECGRPDSTGNIDMTFDYVETILHLENIKNDPIEYKSINLFHTVARVTVADNVIISFKDSNADILFNEELDAMNFMEIPIGTCLGITRQNKAINLLATNENQQNVTEDYFHINNNKIITKKRVMPAMLTLNEEIIRQDCLCYLMERII
jgi:succinylglutamate desuccinylase